MGKTVDKIKRTVKENPSFFIFFVILFGVYFIWWLSFFPGTMTSDSFDMWKEVLTGHFINANPFMYALTMSILTIFHRSPGPMALYQIILFSSIISLFLNYAYKKGIKIIWIALVLGIFVIWPQFGIYNVSIWKDVMYAITCLAASLAVFLFIFDKKINESKRWFFIVVVLCAFVPLYRFNGFFYLFVPPILFYISKVLSWKKSLFMFFSILGFYFLIAIGLSAALKVQQVPAMTEGLMVKNIGGIYSLKNPNLNDFERKSFETMNSKEDWVSTYNCTSVNLAVYDIMKEKGTNSYSPSLDPNKENDDNFKKAFWSAAIKNPKGIIKDKLCLANNMLGYGTVNNFRYNDSIIRGFWHPLIEESSFTPKVKSYLIEYLRWSVFTKERSDFFWATWPLIIILGLAGLVALLKRSFATLAYILLIFINLTIVILLAPAIDYRYVYFVYVMAPFVPILLLLELRGKINFVVDFTKYLYRNDA